MQEFWMLQFDGAMSTKKFATEEAARIEAKRILKNGGVKEVVLMRSVAVMRGDFQFRDEPIRALAAA
jgi:pimeloyl-CoA synthetase